MGAKRRQAWLKSHGYNEGLDDETDTVGVLDCNKKVVDWFFDLADEFVIAEQKGQSRRLIKPSIDTAFKSAKLLRIKPKRRHYKDLKLMMRTAVTEFR